MFFHNFEFDVNCNCNEGLSVNSVRQPIVCTFGSRKLPGRITSLCTRNNTNKKKQCFLSKILFYLENEKLHKIDFKGKTLRFNLILSF